MHSTSSYDAQSKRYAIFKMPTQCRVCDKQRKRGTKFWQVQDVVCVDDNWDPHVNKGRGKNFGDIFSARVESNPGRTAAPSRLSFLTCAAHDLGWEVHKAVCIFLRAIMYRPAYGPSIRAFIFPEYRQPNLCIFLKKHRGLFYFSI